MTWEQPSLFTDEELGIKPTETKHIEKTLPVHDKKLRDQIADEVWQRHLDGSSGGTQWTNHHGLMRCDCEDLVYFIKNKKEMYE